MKIPAMYVQHDVTTGLHFIKSDSVDIIFAGEIMEHFEKKFGIVLLKEIKRILKSGGRFIISTPNKKHSKGYKFHVYEYEINELKELIEKVGLKVDKVWGWVTTEKLVVSSKKKNVRKIYNLLKKSVHKDIAVNLLAYVDPDISDAFCVEGIK